jgi:hypothetical protein
MKHDRHSVQISRTIKRTKSNGKDRLGQLETENAMLKIEFFCVPLPETVLMYIAMFGVPVIFVFLDFDV